MAEWTPPNASTAPSTTTPNRRARSGLRVLLSPGGGKGWGEGVGPGNRRGHCSSASPTFLDTGGANGRANRKWQRRFPSPRPSPPEREREVCRPALKLLAANAQVAFDLAGPRINAGHVPLAADRLHRVLEVAELLAGSGRGRPGAATHVGRKQKQGPGEAEPGQRWDEIGGHGSGDESQFATGQKFVRIGRWGPDQSTIPGPRC